MNNSPYGYGSLINENNETIYQGFMINDDYVCFGVEFFSALYRVWYCGYYWKKGDMDMAFFIIEKKN